MNLENKVGKRSNDSSKILGYALGAFLGLSSLIGCGGGSSNNPNTTTQNNPIPNQQVPQQNRNPVINSNLKINANEGDNFFDKVDATDADGDTLTYSLNRSPNGMIININDGSISWIDAKEGNFPIEVSASDSKGGIATQSSNLVVVNAFDDLSGKITDILKSGEVKGVSVILGHKDNNNFLDDFTNVTDLNGNYSFKKIPTNGNYLVKIINNPNYVGHLAGSLSLNKDEKDVNFELISSFDMNMNFFDQVARNIHDGGQIQRWEKPFEVYINTSPALGSGQIPTQQEIDLAESIFRDEIPKFTNNYFNNIKIAKGTNPPSFGEPNKITFLWRDDLGTGIRGAHGEYLNNNEITSAFASVKTNMLNTPNGEGVYKQEILQTLGARNDSNLETSIFNDPLTNNTIQQIDYDLGKIMYSRPKGNLSINGTPDHNPENYKIR